MNNGTDFIVKYKFKWILNVEFQMNGTYLKDTKKITGL